MGKLSTHVLDTTQGKPAAGVKVVLFAVGPHGKALLKMDVTNAEGRCSSALLEGDAMQIGQYELVFHAGDYFAGVGIALPTPRFIDQVTLAFGIADASQNYHVPLVVSPWAYSTYRGS
ncbi:MAG: 5-hydroxyisourate hydrolase [Janthinobacterium sp.]|jgi:5-hydroxyisourate hydrolase